jgi:hypothetical protein
MARLSQFTDIVCCEHPHLCALLAKTPAVSQAHTRPLSFFFASMSVFNIALRVGARFSRCAGTCLSAQPQTRSRTNTPHQSSCAVYSSRHVTQRHAARSSTRTGHRAALPTCLAGACHRATGRDQAKIAGGMAVARPPTLRGRRTERRGYEHSGDRPKQRCFAHRWRSWAREVVTAPCAAQFYKAAKLRHLSAQHCSCTSSVVSSACRATTE